MTEDEMVGWHHRLNGHEFKQTLGDSEGLVCHHSWGPKELDTNEQLTTTTTVKVDSPKLHLLNAACVLRVTKHQLNTATS